MPQIKLTEMSVKPEAKRWKDTDGKSWAMPKEGQPPLELWDTVAPGLGLRINAGGKRTYFVMPRVNGKQVKFKIGTTTEKKLSEARDKARDVIRDAAKGIDPRDVKEQAEAEARRADASTFEAVVDDFIKKYAQPRQRTWKETERTLKSSCAPWLSKPFASITKRDAYDLLEGFIADDKPYKALTCLSWLRTLWRWAWKRDIVPTPLMDAVEIQVKKRTRDRVYTDAELRAIWKAEGLDDQDRAYLRLLAILVPRAAELAGMRWSEMDNPDKPTIWTIPTARVKISKKKEAEKPRVYKIPLPPIARQILGDMPRNGDLVFPGGTEKKPLEQPFDVGTPFMKKVREETGIEDWFAHAHRDTATTYLQNHGFDQYDRDLLLNHAEAGVSTYYSHGFPMERKATVHNAWADHLAKVVKWSGNVHKLLKRKST